MILLLAGLSIFPNEAKAQQTEEYTRVETYIIDQIRLNRSKLILLQIKFPAEKDRVVRPAFIEDLLNSALVEIPQQGIAISGMVVNEPLNLEYTKFPYQLILEEAVFNKDVNLSGSSFLSLKLNGSVFLGEFLFRFVRVENELWLNSVTFGKYIDLYWSNVGGLLFADDAVFKGEANFHHLRVNGYFLAKNARFDQEAYLAEMEIGELLNISQAHFDSFASFLLTEADFINLDHSIFQDDMELNGTKVNQIFSCNHTVFNGAVNAIGLSVGGQTQCEFSLFTDPEQIADFLGMQSGSMMFRSSSFAGGADFSFSGFTDRVNFTSTTFDGPAIFTSSSFSGGEVKFNEASFNFLSEPAQFNRIHAEGPLLFLNARFTNGLDLSYGDMKDVTISGEKDRLMRIPILLIRMAQIGRELKLDYLSMDCLESDSLTVLGPATIGSIKISDSVNLRNSNFKSLSIAIPGFEWPVNKDDFELGGMEFQDMKISGEDLSEDSWRSVLRLYNQSSYSPLAYKAFIQLLRDRGKPEWADEVELTMKRRERDEVLTPLSAAWFWSWFIELFSGYGKRPYLAFIWSTLVVLVGMAVYAKKENMILVQGTSTSSIYNPFWYSLALFVPFVDFDISEDWKPSPFRKWAYFYRYVHQFLGWILTPIALLVFSGFIK